MLAVFLSHVTTSAALNLEIVWARFGLYMLLSVLFIIRFQQESSRLGKVHGFREAWSLAKSCTTPTLRCIALHSFAWRCNMCSGIFWLSEISLSFCQQTAPNMSRGRNGFSTEVIQAMGWVFPPFFLVPRAAKWSILMLHVDVAWWPSRVGRFLGRFS